MPLFGLTEADRDRLAGLLDAYDAGELTQRPGPAARRTLGGGWKPFCLVELDADLDTATAEIAATPLYAWGRGHAPTATLTVKNLPVDPPTPTEYRYAATAGSHAIATPDTDGKWQLLFVFGSC